MPRDPTHTRGGGPHTAGALPLGSLAILVLLAVVPSTASSAHVPPSGLTTALSPTYAVNFTAEGLGAGTVWAVTLHGVTANTTGPTLEFEEANGTYPFVAFVVQGNPTPWWHGNVTVAGRPVDVTLPWPGVAAAPTGANSEGTLDLDWLVPALALVVACIAISLAVATRGSRHVRTTVADDALAPDPGPSTVGESPSSAGPSGSDPLGHML